MTIKQFVMWFVGASYACPSVHTQFCVGVRAMVAAGTDVTDVAYAINGYFETKIDSSSKWETEVKAHLKEFFQKTVNVEQKPGVVETFLDKLRQADQQERKNEKNRVYDPFKEWPWPQSPQPWVGDFPKKYVLVC